MDIKNIPEAPTICSIKIFNNATNKNVYFLYGSLFIGMSELTIRLDLLENSLYNIYSLILINLLEILVINIQYQSYSSGFPAPLFLKGAKQGGPKKCQHPPKFSPAALLTFSKERNKGGPEE